MQNNLFIRLLSYTIDDMATNALYAFIGRPDPSTGQVLGGMIQVHYTIQDLATYDVSSYSSH